MERRQAEADAAWGGRYDTNVHQTVQADDARNLADALERALTNIPNDRVWEGPMGGPTRLPDGTGKDLPEPNLLEWFSGPEGKARLRAFIKFCRAGAFTIN
jgi:hypothetical protein